MSAAIGATAMCLLDPASGRRRRARLADQARRVGRRTAEATSATARDVRNRMSGVAARAGRLMKRGEPVPDVTLTDRVRAAIGRHLSHARAIDVETVNGCVCLSGPILTTEANSVVSAAAAVPGVREVIDLLDRHETADLPSLQGGVMSTGPIAAWRQARWSPTVKLLAGAGAIAATATAAAYARRR